MIIERALDDALKLEEGGINGILIENYGDIPYCKDTVPLETIAAMSAICYEISKEISIPFGVNVLRNDARAALAIAAVSNASFVRINVHVGVVIADQGIIHGKAHKTLRYREKLKLETKIFADVQVKHAKPLTQRSIEEEAKEAVHRGLADAIIITGCRTGIPPPPEDLKKVKQSLPETPCLVGSGITPENAEELLEIADGCIVGTTLKKNGKTENPVDPIRINKLMNKVYNLRKIVSQDI